ncbi:RAS guanyl-releasing protein 4 isoform X3 [Neofelis nebulosa]|uniref:RAS guanyl-releasing protein 4 isoform X3 n=1 Tax=Neofelis nebulosa TaxID=61452 RepID=UPI00272B03EA|nr:RAS guanyl-releasing protein 4 isoform X3 [Neofelis nebulosa]
MYSVLRLSWQPAPWGPRSQHGTGHAQLGAAFRPPRCPPADLISSQGHEQRVEGGGQRRAGLEDGGRVSRQVGRALTGTQVPGSHRGHTGAEAAADLPPGQVLADPTPRDSASRASARRGYRALLGHCGAGGQLCPEEPGRLLHPVSQPSPPRSAASLLTLTSPTPHPSSTLPLFAPSLSPGGPGPPPPLSSPGLGKKRKVSLLFDHLETEELAQHLTYLEFRSFQAITPQDLRGYVLQGSVRGCPALEGSVGLSNSVSRWVQVMVLSRPGPAQRAQVLDKFIHVAQRLHQLQNFNTLMAVTGGLCHSAISRLKDSHAHLSPDSTKALLELSELLAAHNNYARYRRTWADCTGFRLPVLGVHLKDLVSLHEAQPDRLPDGRLHLPKLNNLYLRLQELAALQRQHPPCSANEDLLHLLTLSLDLFYTEDEIYELSYAREPRCPKSLPPSPFKAPLVVEWAPGVTPKPDRVTLGQHVEQLVESVFKNYDPEGRGTISQEDFERFSGNFPFACHGLHPPPRPGNGSFTREELTAYLLRASAICSKLGLAFLHTFHEVTFRKPTFCDSCSGFLWGVTKQGYRCRDCGLCCHKHCRDRVKVECKKRPGAKGDVSPPGAPGPPTPAPHASCGTEDNLSYTLSLEPETGHYLRHAWTQTEPPHPSWEPQTVPLERRPRPPSPPR